MVHYCVMKRAVGLSLVAALVLSLAGPRTPAESLFLLRTGLPMLAEGQFYQLLSGGYAARQQIYKDEMSLVDLRSGAVLWRLESTDNLRVHASVAGTLVVGTLRYEDREQRVVSAGEATTAGYDIATGRKLWSREGSYLRHGGGGPIIAVYCDNDCGGTGVDVRTGEVVWRTPSLRPSNMVTGTEHWQIERDGTVTTIDLLTGMTATRGKVAAGSWIVGFDEQSILMDGAMKFPEGGGDALPSTAVLHDRATLSPVGSFPIQAGRIPPDLELCGAMVCSRDGVDLRVFDRGGQQRWQATQFSINAVIQRPGGQTLIYGRQSRPGPVPAGRWDNDSNQLLDPESGNALADLGYWRFIHLEPERLWVGLFASRRTAERVIGPSPRREAFLGHIDLRPGSSLTVQGITPLGGPHEDCDLLDGWLLCHDQGRRRPPAALRLRTR
jgi:hypothetical protein